MIKLKTKKEIEKLREGGKILANITKKLVQEIKPGVTTGHLEDVVVDLMREVGGRPAFKGYKSKLDNKPYPSALCTSINNEVVHAPSLPSRQLKDGDIIGIDLGMEYPYEKDKKGYYTDMAVTIVVGEVSEKIKKLINITKESLDLAISKIGPGKKLNDIGGTIQDFVEREGFTIVRDLVGHGVGYDVHEDPQIPNYRVDEKFNIDLEEGMVLAIEPMVNTGKAEISTEDDGFTISTLDKSLSAHFEHTVVITDKGCEVLTKI